MGTLRQELAGGKWDEHFSFGTDALFMFCKHSSGIIE